MTGFGRAAGRVLDREIIVEMRAVNNRYKDVVVRLPKGYAGLEEAV
ncbi:MAG: YicC/YloC family endoribonuclease, partial [Thermodesulfobacteriota bacterium]